MNLVEQSSLFGHCPKVAELFPVHELLISRHLQLWKTWKTQNRFGRILLMKWEFTCRENRIKRWLQTIYVLEWSPGIRKHANGTAQWRFTSMDWGFVSRAKTLLGIISMPKTLLGIISMPSKNQSPRKTSSFLTSQRLTWRKKTAFP